MGLPSEAFAQAGRRAAVRATRSRVLLCERCNLCYKWEPSGVRGQGDREESARCLHAFDCGNQMSRTCIWR
jgi:hypothetical protein